MPGKGYTSAWSLCILVFVTDLLFHDHSRRHSSACMLLLALCLVPTDDMSCVLCSPWSLHCKPRVSSWKLERDALFRDISFAGRAVNSWLPESKRGRFRSHDVKSPPGFSLACCGCSGFLLLRIPTLALAQGSFVEPMGTCGRQVQHCNAQIRLVHVFNC